MHNRKRGLLLLMTLLTLTGLLSLTVVGLGRSMTELTSANRSIASQQAFHLAEAGLDDAFSEFALSGADFSCDSSEHWTGCPGNTRTKFFQDATALLAGTTTTVTVADITADAPVITMTGLASGIQQRIAATLQVIHMPSLRGAAVTGQNYTATIGGSGEFVWLKSGAHLTGDLIANVGGANNLRLESGARVAANLTSGAAGDIQIGPLDPGVAQMGPNPSTDAIVFDDWPNFQSQLDGQVLPPLTSPLTFPDVTVPNNLPSLPLQTNGSQNQYNVQHNQTVHIPCDASTGNQYHFGGLTVQAGGTLIFDCPSTLLLSKGLEVGQDAQVIFRGNTPSTIYVDNVQGASEPLTMLLSSTVKTESVPGGMPMPDGVRFNITNRGSWVSLYWNSSLYGSIYAPYQTTRIRGVAGNTPGLIKEVRGLTSLTSAQLEIWANTSLIFDAGSQSTGEVTSVTLTSWRSLP